MDKSIENRIGFLLTDVGRLCSQLFDERAKARLGLTRAQSRVLAHLSFRGDTNQARLAETLEISPVSLARLLDRMAEGGWIVRIEDENDRRAYIIRATQKARVTVAQVLEVGDSLGNDAMADLTIGEQCALIDLLQCVRRNLVVSLGGGAG
jgi:DNA-binding MarR family transcriptional regulator